MTDDTVVVAYDNAIDWEFQKGRCMCRRRQNETNGEIPEPPYKIDDDKPFNETLTKREAFWYGWMLERGTMLQAYWKLNPEDADPPPPKPERTPLFDALFNGDDDPPPPPGPRAA